MNEQETFNVHRGPDLIATLEYDPIHAVERMEGLVDAKEKEVVRLNELLSEKDAKIVELYRLAAERSEQIDAGIHSIDLLKVQLAELGIRMRQLFRKKHRRI